MEVLAGSEGEDLRTAPVQLHTSSSLSLVGRALLGWFIFSRIKKAKAEGKNCHATTM
jgi:hypothetical protein